MLQCDKCGFLVEDVVEQAYKKTEYIRTPEGVMRKIRTPQVFCLECDQIERDEREWLEEFYDPYSREPGQGPKESTKITYHE